MLKNATNKTVLHYFEKEEYSLGAMITTRQTHPAESVGWACVWLCINIMILQILV